MPKAYWVNLTSEIRDPEKMAAYAALARPAIEALGGKFLARDNAVYAFENAELGRTVVIEFPSVEAAHACHDSEGYQAALAALDRSAERQIRIVEGLE